MNKIEFTIGIVAAIAISGAALAHGGATGIVKERMDGMLAMGKSIKSLSLMMRGDAPYVPDEVVSGAKILQNHAGEALTSLFPEGSDGMPSEAKVEIWQNWQEFEEIANQLATYAAALEVAAPNGLMMEQTNANSGMMGTSSSTMMGNSNSSMMGTGQSGMMGSSSPMGAEELGAMPADAVFNMIAQTCASCHEKFRAEKK